MPSFFQCRSLKNEIRAGQIKREAEPLFKPSRRVEVFQEKRRAANKAVVFDSRVVGARVRPLACAQILKPLLCRGAAGTPVHRRFRRRRVLAFAAGGGVPSFDKLPVFPSTGQGQAVEECRGALSGEPLCQKKRLTIGCARAADMYPLGTKVEIRMPEENLGFTIEDDSDSSFARQEHGCRQQISTFFAMPTGSGRHFHFIHIFF